MPLTKQIAFAFPTLIGRFTAPAPAAAAVNTELRQLILAREQAGSNHVHANAGGWHSDFDLLEWPSPAVQTLREWILEAVQHMIGTTLEYVKTVGLNRRFSGSVQLQAWANVSRRHHFHRLHNHPGNAWSGTYYVASGTDAEAAANTGGTLELIDPRPFTEMTYVPGDPYGQRIPIQPVPGMLVVFPSFLYHFVNPHTGDGERISIAFNARASDRR
jgi:uncharacterized protein (TIGR02466 family)